MLDMFARMPKKKIIPFLLLVLVLTLIFPRTPKLGYEYKKGSAWTYETLYAQFDFPILKTADQIQEEKTGTENTVIPYFKYSEEIVNKSLKAAESLSLGKYNSLKPAIVTELKNIYNKGVLADAALKNEKNLSHLSSEVLYVQKDKRAVKHPVAEVYKLTDAKSKLLADIRSINTDNNLDSVFRVNSVYDLVVPNLIYDKQTTDLVNAESDKSISPTIGYVNAGQLIVSNGEIVTAEIAQMLDSYDVEYESNFGYSGPEILLWLGNLLIAVILTLIFYLSILFTNNKILDEFNRLAYLMLIFVISSLTSILITKVGAQYIFLLPVTLLALWLQAFFKNRVIICTYTVSLLPILIYTNSGPCLFVMYLFAGMVSIYFFKYFNRGWRQFVSALITFAALASSYLGFRLIDAVSTDTVQSLVYLFVGSFLTVLGYPVIFLFERMFNLVSNSRLIELGDTSNSLIRELEAKAPGTLQHSLQVMSMADFVARSIGANALLVRAGALYHDIGKMNNPLCFIENESVSDDPSQKYHAGLDYLQSAKDIICHVTDGIELAEKHRLPKIIKDFIITHHGTTCTRYFYDKYVNEGGDPEKLPEFCYPGAKPKTKEQIIVMLCDSIEAASRTLKNPSPEVFSDFVERMVSAKWNEGQFENADITVRELNIVKESLKMYLGQLYHERVVYPKRKAR